MLAHELAHIRRHDYLVNMLQILTETLFFYQPAVWWISSRIRDERELCCDDMAVEICGGAVGCARALAKLERFRITASPLAFSGAAGPLLYRIQTLTGAVDEQPASKLPAAVAACLAVICFVASLHWANGAPQTARPAVVRREAIWVDTVKYGDFPILIRALGTVTAPDTAELNVAASQASLLQIGQSASIELRHGLTMAGKVTRIDSNAAGGSVTAAVLLLAPVPEFEAQPIDGTIQIKTVSDVVYVGRPAATLSDGETSLFKLEPDGSHAKRVKVRIGAQSVSSVQILDGIKRGDHVILSAMTKYDGYDRIRLE